MVERRFCESNITLQFFEPIMSLGLLRTTLGVNLAGVGGSHMERSRILIVFLRGMNLGLFMVLICPDILRLKRDMIKLRTSVKDLSGTYWWYISDILYIQRHIGFITLDILLLKDGMI